MGEKFSDSFKLYALAICSVIGAGFISGAEVFEFYARFGEFAYLGITVFFVLCTLLTYKIVYNKKIEKVQNLCNTSPKKAFLSKNKIKSFIINMNVLLISGAMFSGLVSTSKTLLGSNYLLPLILCYVAVFFILLVGINGLSKVDFFVLAFLLLVVCIFAVSLIFPEHGMGILMLTQNNEFKFGTLILSVLFSALHLFMNIVGLCPLVSECGIKFSKKGALLFSVLLSGTLSAILTIFAVFLQKNIYFSLFSMPFLQFFVMQGGFLKVVFVIGLLLALLSTLLSCLIGVKQVSAKIVQKICPKNADEKKDRSFKNFLATSASVVVGMLLGLIDFNLYVSYVYPAIGVLNFFVLLFL